MNEPRQLPLDFDPAPRYGREDFLAAPCNERALALVESWPAWPDRIVLLVGPSGSGKSHLGAIWARRVGARTLRADALTQGEAGEADPATLAAAGAVLLEDAEAVANEAALFHLMNLTRETGGWLLATARAYPQTWALRTPDLLSRLRLAPTIDIAPPDDDLMRAVLVKLFHDRQLRVDASVVDYLALRLDRSVAAAAAAVNALDREALARGRAVTRPMAADLLGRAQDDKAEGQA